jgi:hypothetical protein
MSAYLEPMRVAGLQIKLWVHQVRPFEFLTTRPFDKIVPVDSKPPKSAFIVLLDHPGVLELATTTSYGIMAPF